MREHVKAPYNMAIGTVLAHSLPFVFADTSSRLLLCDITVWAEGIS